MTRRLRAIVRKPAGPLEAAVPRRGRQRYTREDCLRDLRLFDENAPAGVRRTQAGYRAFAREHGLVAPSGLQRHGRFQELLKEARGGR